MGGQSGGRLSIGACSVGAAQACFEIAVKYVKALMHTIIHPLLLRCNASSFQERRQFGKAISEQQATQFKLADMAGKISCSRLVLRLPSLFI